FGSPAARSSAPLIQTMLCAFEELLASTLQRINPRRRATCASAIRVTFRQKRGSLGIYFDSALAAMPTFVICERRNGFQVHHLIVEPDRLAAVDRERLHL